MRLTRTQAALFDALRERAALGRLRIENDRRTAIGGLSPAEEWERVAVVPHGEWVDGYPGRRIAGCSIATYAALARAGLVIVRNGAWGIATSGDK